MNALVDRTAAKSGTSWIHIGLAPAGGRPGALFGEMAALVRDWRRQRLVDGFFFMNKPPGLRVRFATAPAREPVVRAALRDTLGCWRAAGLLAHAEPGVYVPEEHRFGGAGPMVRAHRMFTEDAVAWLGFHARPRTTPAWALSLTMLRTVFDAMAVRGAREREVWSRVAAAGRQVPAGLTVPVTTAAGVRTWWRRPPALPDEEVRHLAAAHATRITPLARAWARALGDTDADDTPDALAWYVVFHWNRAALSYGRQALLTTALAANGAGGHAC